MVNMIRSELDIVYDWKINALTPKAQLRQTHASKTRSLLQGVESFHSTLDRDASTFHLFLTSLFTGVIRLEGSSSKQGFIDSVYGFTGYGFTGYRSYLPNGYMA